MMRSGHTYRSHQKLRVQCPEYAADLAESLLVAHHNPQNGVSMGAQWDAPPIQGSLINIVCPFCALQGKVSALSVHYSAK